MRPGIERTIRATSRMMIRRTSFRWLRALCSMSLASSLATSVLAAPVPRFPQVPISGTALQSWLDQHAYPSAVATEHQLDMSIFPEGPAGQVWTLLSPALTDTLGLYDATQADPRRMPLFVPGSSPGRVTVVVHHHSTGMLNFLRLDESANFTVTRYPLPQGELGIYLERPTGVLYSEDARNAEQEPRMLVYPSAHHPEAQSFFIGIETQLPGTVPAGDFADLFLGLDLSIGLPVRRTTWGEVKQRFR